MEGRIETRKQAFLFFALPSHECEELRNGVEWRKSLVLLKSLKAKFDLLSGENSREGGGVAGEWG